MKHVTVIALVLLFSLCCLVGCSTDQKVVNGGLKGNLAKIQGKWQSEEDALSMIEIKADKFISYYENQAVSTETIEFINNAEARQADPNGQYFIVKGEFDAMIYYLISVSDSQLEYSFVGRGNTLKYVKINLDENK